MIKFLSRLSRDRKGATAIEYGLIAALIAVAIVGSVRSFGTKSATMWNNVSTTVLSN